MNDPVNHPPHYTQHPSGVECIDITEHYNFNLGNAMKYIWRAGLKDDAVEDLQKAQWYLEREVRRLGHHSDRSHEKAFVAENEKLWRSVSVARLVTDHWRRAAMTYPDNNPAAVMAVHALGLVLMALNGETDPNELGVAEGPDADAIRKVVS